MEPRRHNVPSAVGVWAGLQFIPINSMKMPSMMEDVAGSRTWSDTLLSSGSGAVKSTGIGSGTDIEAGPALCLQWALAGCP